MTSCTHLELGFWSETIHDHSDLLSEMAFYCSIRFCFCMCSLYYFSKYLHWFTSKTISGSFHYFILFLCVYVLLVGWFGVFRFLWGWDFFVVVSLCFFFFFCFGGFLFGWFWLVGLFVFVCVGFVWLWFLVGLACVHCFLRVSCLYKTTGTISLLGSSFYQDK